MVFTANATAAIKLVIDCFRDHAAVSNTPVWYGYHRDAHTSLVGVRELTKMHRCFTSDREVETWINSGGLGGPRSRQLGLFAYPGQSNMTGRRLPLDWPGRIRRNLHKATTYTLLDVAALAGTAALDLSDIDTAPDFVTLSFYKIFGFPNVGALLVRKESQHVLADRRYFGGGTVDMIITINDAWHAKKETALHDRLEDGTLPFHSIFALDHAIDVHERLYGPNPMKFISLHTAQLGKQLYDGLRSIAHRNGLPVAIIYKDSNAVYGDPTLQGATLAFNIQNSNGSLVGYEQVEEAADKRNIFLRSGGMCNPGGVATYLEWSAPEMRSAYAAGHRCSNPTQVVLGKPTGVVRVSLGAMSTSSDVQTFLDFIAECYVEADTGGALSQNTKIDSPQRPSRPSAPQRSLTEASTAVVAPRMQSPRLVQIGRPSTSAGSTVASSIHTSPADFGSMWDPPTSAAASMYSVPTSPPQSFNLSLFPTPNTNQPNTLNENALDRNTIINNHSTTAIPSQKPYKTVGLEIKIDETTEFVHPHTLASQRAAAKAAAAAGKKGLGRSVVNLLHRKTTVSSLS